MVFVGRSPDTATAAGSTRPGRRAGRGRLEEEEEDVSALHLPVRLVLVLRLLAVCGRFEDLVVVLLGELEFRKLLHV